ncbi:MAG: efflux RND transporter permease subunit, partial [Limisphaerales bacterium]
MQRIAQRFKQELPELSAYFQNGGMVDAVVNLGMPAPLDIQVSSMHLKTAHAIAVEIARQVRGLSGVSGVLVPQDMDYPALKLEVDRLRAAELGLSTKEVVSSVITALTSDAMIAPSYWVDPSSGNDYLLTVQYPENLIKSLVDLGSLPLRGRNRSRGTRLENVSHITHMRAPTEVDHYQLRRTVDVYVSPEGEDLGSVYDDVRNVVDNLDLPSGVRVNVRGAVKAMDSAFKSFGYGLLLSTLLVYLILVAQFRSFLDPLLILVAVPAGLAGTMATMFLTGTTLNVMSLMGAVMMVGIVVSNSILIVECVRRAQQEGNPLRRSVWLGSRASLRPIIVTSLATLVGLAPLAANLGTGGEAYAAMASAIIGGLALSFVLTIFLVPAVYYSV